ncbi:hypothetical protein KR084_005074, partial [Drosophila pseudotakahashii]
GRVVGGSAAAVNSAPYAVSMQYGGTHYCAASILNANWLVTAAHCLTNSNQVLGSTLVAGSIEVAGTATTTQTRSITYFVINDLYTGGTVPYDIGLIYTPTAFVWSAAVAPVTLPSSGVVPTGTANLYGWGSTSTTNTASYPSTLQVATNVPIITLSACESALGTKGSDVHNTNVCTGPLTGGISICTSDSGGPLVQGNVLIGIVSWGKLPCGQANSPSVYVQVSSFIPWISSNQQRQITHYVINDLYTGGTVPYDIGLIYTPTAFVWTAAVAAVKLPSSGSRPTGSANLFGWGSTSKTNSPSYPATLQEAKNIPIISLNSCATALGTKGQDVHTTNLCTGPLTGGTSFCTSDSGGPLVQGDVLIGIVSWGKLPCGQPNSPSVYVQVSSFTSWIAANQKI